MFALITKVTNVFISNIQTLGKLTANPKIQTNRSYLLIKIPQVTWFNTFQTYRPKTQTFKPQILCMFTASHTDIFINTFAPTQEQNGGKLGQSARPNPIYFRSNTIPKFLTTAIRSHTGQLSRWSFRAHHHLTSVFIEKHQALAKISLDPEKFIIGNPSR